MAAIRRATTRDLAVLANASENNASPDYLLFHVEVFPKNDPERRKQWIINMKCKGWNPQQNHRVCSVHFEDKYICGRDIRQRLTPDAVPTIFDYPKNVQNKIKDAWEWLGMDIRGPLPLTPNGHQHVLTLTDFYSKWVEAFPLRGCSSTEVAQHVAEVISHFGFPFGIH
ncbi:THAP domain-containing protein 2-like [Oncorhynchus kisutch]|uniref:THAP domain-containing protein 2-like n=1 Tax=Oncorhynchus kisutch TaxID=8019 RepID=UPI0012DCCA85|nr:THAP domain-containing protein 2-like [Oncorhynchus kisutch]